MTDPLTSAQRVVVAAVLYQKECDRMQAHKRAMEARGEDVSSPTVSMDLFASFATASAALREAVREYEALAEYEASGLTPPAEPR